MSERFTKEEAKLKYCWVSLSANSGVRFCKADEYMGWYWSSANKAHGYCCKGE